MTFKVAQGHWHWCHSTVHIIWFLLSLPL